MTTPSEGQSREAWAFSMQEPIGAGAKPKSPAPDVECVAALESMGNLLKKITMIWGTRELDKLIQGLFMDSRDGARQGFPQPVAQELMFLAECNKMVRAIESAQSLGISVTEAHRMVDAGDQAVVTGGSSPWNDPSSSKDTLSRDNSQRKPNSSRSSAQPAARASGKEGSGKGLFFWIFMIIAILVAAQIGMKLFAHLK